MTKAQIKKINTLTGRLEALQHEIRGADREVVEAVAAAKNEMMRALRRAEEA
jgi:hypothetical protein